MPSSIWTYCYTFTLGERERGSGGGGGGGGKEGEGGDHLLSFFIVGEQESCCPTGNTSEPVSQRWPCSIEMLWLDQKKVWIILFFITDSLVEQNHFL